MSETKYRPDVDGLRALAVTLVLLFHGRLFTGHLAFSGGFVGVDVFFVISGYLITGLILRQQQAGTFSLADFWSRRIRRIFPAALVMACLTMVVGAVVLFPTDYEELARSTVAQQLMAANLFFWRNTGYFQGPAELKPLLHTWSLAVEEQFYLVYPFLLVWIMNWRPSKRVALLIVLALSSFILSEWGVRHFRGATFFLLPTRAWELLLGALICYCPSLSASANVRRQGLSLLGLAMILFSAMTLDGNTRFPGAAAAIPCLGAAFLIYSNTQQLSLVGKILASRPVVWIGLISYSLYLWHWPVLAYLRYLLGAELPFGMVVLAYGISLILAYLSWRYIETPFRKSRPAKQQRRVLIGIILTAPALIALSLLVIRGNGYPNRMSEEATRLRAAAFSKSFIQEVSLPDVQRGDLPKLGSASGDSKCLIWGDSHAMALTPGFDAACQELTIRAYQATHSSTPPLLGYSRFSEAGLNELAPEFSQAVLDWVKKEEVSSVVLAGYWSDYARFPEFERQISETLAALNTQGVRVAIILDVAVQASDVPLALANHQQWRYLKRPEGIDDAKHRERNREAEAILRRVAAGKATILDPAVAFLDATGMWRVEHDGQVLYRDAEHLTTEGGLLLKEMFREWLQPSVGRDKEGATKTGSAATMN